MYDTVLSVLQCSTSEIVAGEARDVTNDECGQESRRRRLCSVSPGSVPAATEQERLESQRMASRALNTSDRLVPSHSVRRYMTHQRLRSASTNQYDTPTTTTNLH